MEKEEGRAFEPEPKLPRASVEKIVSEIVISPLTCSREAKHYLLNMCVEFVHIIATEANGVCEQEQKKTVTHEHVYTALRNLGYGTYVEECHNAYRDHIEQTKMRPSRQNKFKDSGLTQDQLEKEQEELFRKAKIIALNEKNETEQ